MGERIANWMIWTCALALIPVIARLFVWSISTGGVEPLAVSDMVAFGLVLHSANINEVSRISADDYVWKSVHLGLSIIFIVVYALLLFVTIMTPTNLKISSVINWSVALSIVSFLLSASVFARKKAVEI